MKISTIPSQMDDVPHMRPSDCLGNCHWILTCVEGQFLEDSKTFQTDCGRVRREVSVRKMTNFQETISVFKSWMNVRKLCLTVFLEIFLPLPLPLGLWSLYLIILWLYIALIFTYIILFNQYSTKVWLPHLLSLSIPSDSDYCTKESCFLLTAELFMKGSYFAHFHISTCLAQCMTHVFPTFFLCGVNTASLIHFYIFINGNILL